MPASFSIAGIGNPAMGLGTLGLGASGSYGSYDNYMPSMIGMNGSMYGTGSLYGTGTMGSYPGMTDMTGMTGASGLTGMGGMMGMYNPLYYTQMQSAAEKIQAQHAGEMHNQVLQNEVNAHRETDSALIQKVLTNGTVQQGVQNLYNKVREGDQDGICRMFSELKEYIFNNYKDELNARGSKINPSVAAAQIIEAVYANIVSAQTGEVADLRSDIQRYGDGAMMNGFMSGFREDHHGRYVDETLNYCFGLPIDQKGSKDKRKEFASYAGRGASILEKSVYGAAGGVALYGIGKAVTGGFKSTFGKGKAAAGGGAAKSGLFKKFGKAAWIGAAIGAAADIWWQLSASNSSNAA